tara:strand:+ start:457 stop:594 length:138 start_codon:yes stop_codon:yes gene_type:complete
MDRMAEMEIFVAVVDSGGFTEAANKLRLSSPLYQNTLLVWNLDLV